METTRSQMFKYHQCVALLPHVIYSSLSLDILCDFWVMKLVGSFARPIFGTIFLSTHLLLASFITSSLTFFLWFYKVKMQKCTRSSWVLSWCSNKECGKGVLLSRNLYLCFGSLVPFGKLSTVFGTHLKQLLISYEK